MLTHTCLSVIIWRWHLSDKDCKETQLCLIYFNLLVVKRNMLNCSFPSNVYHSSYWTRTGGRAVKIKQSAQPICVPSIIGFIKYLANFKNNSWMMDSLQAFKIPFYIYMPTEFKRSFNLRDFLHLCFGYVNEKYDPRLLHQFATNSIWSHL